MLPPPAKSASMVLVRQSLPLGVADEPTAEIAIRVDRLKLAKRLWRAIADDGMEFGFELEQPLRHRDVVWENDHAHYVIQQTPETVLSIPLPETPEAAALLGWIIGNLHFVIETQPTRLLAPDDPALRQALQRLHISFHDACEVFQPHRLAASIAHSHAPAAPVTEHPYIRPSRPR